MSKTGWIAVDLDGTLAFYDGWKGIEHIGDPIPHMLERVRRWLERGADVRIFTARVIEGPEAIGYIKQWCEKHLGVELPVTNIKDFSMIQLWDDRAVGVEQNTGEVTSGVPYGEATP